jgi:hypothetical protein
MSGYGARDHDSMIAQRGRRNPPRLIASAADPEHAPEPIARNRLRLG